MYYLQYLVHSAICIMKGQSGDQEINGSKVHAVEKFPFA